MEMASHNPAKQLSTETSPTTRPEITLRPVELSDIDDFMAWASDKRVTRFTQRDALTSKEDALIYLRDTIIPHPWHRAICLENRPVGSVAVKPGGPGIDGCRASISYRLAHDHWGRGIATEAVRKATAAVFGEWPLLERLEAVADAGNRASQRVLEKAGFQREGVMRRYLLLKGKAIDVVMYSFLPAAAAAAAGSRGVSGGALSVRIEESR